MIRRAAFAFDRTVQKISAVKLNAWFGGPHFHLAAGFGVEESNYQNRLRASVAVENPIVVVALAKFQLFVVECDARTDGRGLAKIERSAGDGTQLAGRDQAFIDGSELLRRDH